MKDKDIIELIPSWAERTSDGTYMEEKAQLCTRDGRKIGNAVVVKTYYSEDIGREVAVCVTDVGNTLIFTERELEALFYPPKYIFKKIGAD